MAENPFASMLNPNARQAGLYDMRMMSAANRSESPFEHGMRSSYGSRGVSGDPMLAGLAGMANEPDYSQFTYNPQAHAAASAALAPYGLSPLEAGQVKSNVLLPNGGFFGRHPHLSGAIEGGIFSAAASHGGNTTGESIQGALEGLIGGQRIRQGMQRQQFARPFEAAGMLEGMQDMRQKRDLQEAEIQHLRAENQKLGRPDHDFRALGNAGPQDSNIPIIDNTTGQVTNTTNPNFDPEILKQMHRQPGAGTDFDRFLEMANSERAKAGKPPMNSAQVLETRGKWGAASAGPSASSRDAAQLPYQNYQDARREHDKRIDGFNAKMLKADDPQHIDAARQTLVQQRMSEAMQARANGQSYNKSLLPTDADIKGYIQQTNTGIQQQIDSERVTFKNQWPQAMEAPPAPKGSKNSSPKTGSSPNRIPTFNQSTGRLE